MRRAWAVPEARKYHRNTPRRGDQPKGVKKRREGEMIDTGGENNLKAKGGSSHEIGNFVPV